MNKTYKVVSDDLNLVLFVKGFTLEQERKLYNNVRSKIEKAVDPISVESYREFIAKKFLVDSESFFDQIESSDEEEKISQIDSVYEAIVGLYPPFSLEFVCQDLNADTFFSGVDRKFLKNIQEQVRSGVEGLKGGLEFPSIALSSLGDIQDLQLHLEDNIVGQRDAILSITNALKLMASGLSRHSSFLFVGPTGVGKTQLAKLLGDKYSGNFYKINCAEYAGAHEYAKLIGSPPGYVGHTDKSLLAEKAEKSNRWIFLFDEIEKAHHKLYDFLLSLLDDGTCTDNMGSVLDFTESIFVFTSNQGVGEIKRDSVGFDRKSEVDVKVTSEVIRKSVKRHFSPEFLNRLDEIVLFNSLTKKEVKQIATLQLEDLPIVKTNPLIDFVVDGGYSEEYGARNIQRFIKNRVAIKVADQILNKRVPKKSGELYTPKIVKGEVTIVNTKKYNVSSS
jgi:ATP-dependent Clp protease ATP-binding subunit ClpC